MSAKLSVAAIQMVSGDDVATNLVRAGDMIETAAKQGARLVVLPENFCAFGGGRQRLIGAQDLAWALINSPGFLFNH